MSTLGVSIKILAKTSEYRDIDMLIHYHIIDFAGFRWVFNSLKIIIGTELFVDEENKRSKVIPLTDTQRELLLTTPMSRYLPEE